MNDRRIHDLRTGPRVVRTAPSVVKTVEAFWHAGGRLYVEKLPSKTENEGTLCYSPAISDRIGLWNGQNWEMCKIPGKLELDTSGLLHDFNHPIYVRKKPDGEVELCVGSGYVFSKDGAWVDQTDNQKRYVGSAWVQPPDLTCIDTQQFRGVNNLYNRLWKRLSQPVYYDRLVVVGLPFHPHGWFEHFPLRERSSIHLHAQIFLDAPEDGVWQTYLASNPYSYYGFQILAQNRATGKNGISLSWSGPLMTHPYGYGRAATFAIGPYSYAWPMEHYQFEGVVLL